MRIDMSTARCAMHPLETSRQGGPKMPPAVDYIHVPLGLPVGDADMPPWLSIALNPHGCSNPVANSIFCISKHIPKCCAREMSKIAFSKHIFPKHTQRRGRHMSTHMSALSKGAGDTLGLHFRIAAAADDGEGSEWDWSPWLPLQPSVRSIFV